MKTEGGLTRRGYALAKADDLVIGMPARPDRLSLAVRALGRLDGIAMPLPHQDLFHMHMHKKRR